MCTSQFVTTRATNFLKKLYFRLRSFLFIKPFIVLSKEQARKALYNTSAVFILIKRLHVCGLPLGCTCLNVTLLAKSLNASGKSCDRPFGQRFPLVFIALRTNDELVPKSDVAALVFRASPQSNYLNIFRPHSALPALLKFRRNAILQTQKFSPNSQLLQQPTLHHLFTSSLHFPEGREGTAWKPSPIFVFSCNNTCNTSLFTPIPPFLLLLLLRSLAFQSRAMARVRSWSSLSEICGVRRGIGTNFSPSSSVFRSQHNFIIAPYLSLY